MTNRVALALVFTLSFLSYMTPDLSVLVQLAPLGLFAALVFFKVIWSESVLDAVSSLFEVDGLLYVLFISVLIIAPSVASGSEKSLETAVVIAICLVLARIYMAVVPVREVLEAFFWSGILSVAVFIPLNLAGFMKSIETLERFSAFNFHPNLLAFLLAGYLCAMTWKFLSGDWRLKVLTGFTGFACLMIVFFASSRGSIVAILVSSLFAGGIVLMGVERQLRRKILRRGLCTPAVMIALVFVVQTVPWVQNAYAFVDQVLQLSQDYRGIDSGLSGRLNNWYRTLGVFSDGTWLLGHGIRSSDSRELDQFIDNSYLVILYETGFVPLCLIIWRFFSISIGFVKGYFQSTDKTQRYFHLAGILLMAVFLVNNIVDRYLFSVGNPYSLLALLFFAAPMRRGLCERKQLRAVPSLAHP